MNRSYFHWMNILPTWWGWNWLLNWLTWAWEWDTSGSYPDSLWLNDWTINGATYNASWWYDFTTNDYIDLWFINYFSATAFSISCWVKKSSNSGIHSIVWRDDDVPVANRYFQFRTDSSTGKIRAVRFDSGNNVVTNFLCSTALSTWTWYMVTFVFDNTVWTKVYLNTSVDWSDTVTTNNNNGTWEKTLIWARNSNSINNYLEWAINRTRFWNRALSSTDISTLYNSWAWLAYSSFTT